MTQDEIDIMWQQAMKESIKDGEIYTRYHFAKLVAEHEREACEKTCNDMADKMTDMAAWGAQECLKAIKALKERLADPMREVQRLGQEIKQEPVAWLVEFENEEQELHFGKQSVGETQTPLYTHPPPRTWIGLEGAEFGWFCHTDFLNARKYTKKQRQLICCQLLSEAQSWDIGNYQLMMHDSTKLKENT